MNDGSQKELWVNIRFKGSQLDEFLAVKEYLGIQTNTDVIRHLIRKQTRLIHRRARRFRASDSGVQVPGSRFSPGRVPTEASLELQVSGSRLSPPHASLETSPTGDAAPSTLSPEKDPAADPDPRNLLSSQSPNSPIPQSLCPRPPSHPSTPTRELTPTEQLCLHCPLPECDETNPHCPFQKTTRERERKLARMRDYMRRRRAAKSAMED